MTQDQLQKYREALKEARLSFERAMKRRREIMFEDWHLGKEIARLRRTITALAAMCSENPLLDDLGITEACTEVMQNEKTEMTTVDVVERIERMGYDVGSQKNVAASVHAILSRLAAKGVIRKETNEGTKTVVWKGPNYDPMEIPF